MRTQTYADRKLAQKAGIDGSNSNVQRYIYTAKEINRQMDKVDGAIAPTTAIQHKRSLYSRNNSRPSTSAEQ